MLGEGSELRRGGEGEEEDKGGGKELRVPCTDGSHTSQSFSCWLGTLAPLPQRPLWGTRFQGAMKKLVLPNPPALREET